MPKRLRLLIYEHDTRQGLLDQMKQDGVQRIKQVPARGMTITSIELNPFNITIMELLRLFRRESK
jgi:hypothetical protein